MDQSVCQANVQGGSAQVRIVRAMICALYCYSRADYRAMYCPTFVFILDYLERLGVSFVPHNKGRFLPKLMGW